MNLNNLPFSWPSRALYQHAQRSPSLFQDFEFSTSEIRSRAVSRNGNRASDQVLWRALGGLTAVVKTSTAVALRCGFHFFLLLLWVSAIAQIEQKTSRHACGNLSIHRVLDRFVRSCSRSVRYNDLRARQRSAACKRSRRSDDHRHQWQRYPTPCSVLCPNQHFLAFIFKLLLQFLCRQARQHRANQRRRLPHPELMARRRFQFHRRPVRSCILL